MSVSGPLGKLGEIPPSCLLGPVLLHLLSIPQKPHMPGPSVGSLAWVVTTPNMFGAVWLMLSH